MDERSNGVNYNEMKAELQALRKKLEDLETRQAAFKISAPATVRRSFPNRLITASIPLAALLMVAGGLLWGYITTWNITSPYSVKDLTAGTLKAGGALGATPTGPWGLEATSAGATVKGTLNATNADVTARNLTVERPNVGGVTTPFYEGTGEGFTKRLLGLVIEAKGDKGPQLRFARAGSNWIDIGQDGGGNFAIGIKDQAVLTIDSSGNTVIKGTVNGEKPPRPALRFAINATGSGNWNTVVKDIGDLCGDEDGCRIKLLMHHSIEGRVRTITEEVYIGNPGRTKFNGGLGGYTRQSGGPENLDEWQLDTTATKRLFRVFDWCQATNYIPNGDNLLSVPEGTPTVRDKAFQGANKYKIAFSCHPHIMGEFIIYDR